MRKNLTATLAGLLFLTVLPALVRADDWPQWRGPNRDGVWRETGILNKFPDEQIEIRWRKKIGPGYSGPTVADGRVFVTDRQIEPKQIERVLCFDAKSGIEIWSYAYDCPYVGVGYKAGPRASVTIHDGRAYALGTMGHLHCFDAGSGHLLWKKTPGVDYKIRMPVWGIASAPLVVDDLLIVQIGGEKGACLIAYHRKDGDEQWRALDDKASYSAPMLIEQAGRPVLICWTGEHVAGLDPDNGKVYWRVPYKQRRWIINVPMPVLHGEELFCSAFMEGSLLLALRQDRVAVTERWRRMGRSEMQTDALHCMMSTPLMDDKHIYGVDSYGELRCLEAATGDRVWQDLTATPKARWSNIHMVRNKDKVWMFNERGELIIARLSPKGFDEISRAKLIKPTTVQLSRRGGVCWSHPAFAGRHVFARNDEELVCASLEAD